MLTALGNFSNFHLILLSIAAFICDLLLITFDWLAHLYVSLDLESHRRCIPLTLEVGPVIEELCHTLN